MFGLFHVIHAIPRYSTWFHILFHVVPSCAMSCMTCYSTLFSCSMLFQTIPCYSTLFKVIPYDFILFYAIPWYSKLFHVIACYSMWFHVIPCFQAISYYSTLFHVIQGFSALFLIISCYSTLFHVIPSFQTVGGPWLVVFVRHSLGVCVGFQAFKLQQGQFGAILLVCAFLLYSTLSSFHVMPDDSMLFHVILCCSSLHVIP